MFWAKVLPNIFIFNLKAVKRRQQLTATNGELLHLVEDQQNCRIFWVHIYKATLLGDLGGVGWKYNNSELKFSKCGWMMHSLSRNNWMMISKWLEFYWNADMLFSDLFLETVISCKAITKTESASLKWKSAQLIKGFAFGKKKKTSVNLKATRANWCEICADNKLYPSLQERLTQAVQWAPQRHSDNDNVRNSLGEMQ